MKIRALSSAARKRAPKRARIGDLELLSHNLDIPDDSQHDLWSWCDKVTIRSNGWGIAGCFDVKYPATGPKAETVKYCHWADALKYSRSGTPKVVKLCLSYSEHSIFLYLDDVESQFCSKAVELARGPDKVPFGTALLEVLQSDAAIWNSKEALVKRGERQSQRNDRSPPPPRAPEPMSSAIVLTRTSLHAPIAMVALRAPALASG